MFCRLEKLSFDLSKRFLRESWSDGRFTGLYVAQRNALVPLLYLLLSTFKRQTNSTLHKYFCLHKCFCLHV